MANSGRVEIAGSVRKQPGNPVAIPVAASERITATIILRHDPSFPDVGEQLLAGTFAALSSDKAEESTSAATADITAIQTFACDFGLSVQSIDAASRAIKISGTAKKLGDAFGVVLTCTGSSLSYAGALTVPEDLDGIILAVLGLDTHPVARPHSGLT